MWMAKAFSFGTAARMGPAYFPTVIGGMLAAFGMFITFRGLVLKGEGVGSFHLKTLFLILTSLALFGITLQYLGLFCAVLILVVISSMGGHEFRMREALMVSACLAVSSVAVFVFALKLQIPIWPSF